jgi:hypothetical protein
MDNQNDADTTEEAAGSGAASAETNSDGLQNTAQQLEATVSRFAQDTEHNQESLTTLLRQVSEQTSAANAGVQDVRSELRAKVEKLESWIKYNRR